MENQEPEIERLESPHVRLSFDRYGRLFAAEAYTDPELDKSTLGDPKLLIPHDDPEGVVEKMMVYEDGKFIPFSVQLAKIEDGVVVNVEEWPSLKIANESSPDDQFMEIGENHVGIGWVVDGEGFAPPPPPPPLPVEEQRERAFVKLNEGLTKVQDMLTEGYPDFIREGWDHKALEARGVLSGTLQPEDAILLLAECGGVPENVPGLAERVNRKANLYKQINGHAANTFDLVSQKVMTATEGFDEIVQNAVDQLMKNTKEALANA